MGYYELPADLLDDREAARVWAEGAIEVARRAAGRKAKGRGRQ
jgi:TfoX/Sxy family transcriptional regulator of competence genes